MYYRNFAALTLASVLSVFSGGCSGISSPNSRTPASVTAHAVVSGIHDIVMTTHAVWSQQLNARVTECEKKYPPTTSHRDDFIGCVKPFDRNEEIVEGLRRLVEAQRRLKSFSGTAEEILATIEEVVIVSTSILEAMGADKSATNRVAQLKELYVHSTSPKNPQ